MDSHDNSTQTSLPDNCGGDDDTTHKNNINNNGDSSLIGRRSNRKAIPFLGEGDFTIETTKILNGPIVFRNPMLTTTSPSLDEDAEVTETGPVERPIAVEARTRRVSDVIDSLGDGNSAPNSPRNKSFAEAMNSPTRTVMKVLPDFLPKADPKQPAGDSVDAVPMGFSSVNDDDDAFVDPSHTNVVASMSTEPHATEYNMNHPRRGKAVIFNHEVFDVAGFQSRPGTDVDAKNLEVTFLELGFEVTVHHNLEHAAIKNCITQLRKEDHTDADCLMVVVLSHGMQGGFVLAKDVPYPIDSLWHTFKADLCPTLAGKPKIFLVQACRGERLDAGVHMMRSNTRTQVDSASSDYKLPSFADFLVAFSTVEGHYAWRSPEHGTWFVQSICRELKDSGTSVDLLKLMTRAARRVAVDHESFTEDVPWQHAMKQVPAVTTMLIRDIYFRPKPILSRVQD